MSYGNMLAKRLNFMRDEKDIDNILYIPFAFENFDKADIIARLDHFIPENMMCTFQSKLVKELKDKDPSKFK